MEKITPEKRQKIIEMRLDGATWKEVIEKLNLRQGANTGIYKAKWFLEGKKAVKEKRKAEPKKKVVQTPIKEEKKEEIKVPIKEKKESAKSVEKEVTKHIKSSDKAPASTKKKEVVGSEKTKEPEEKKNSFGLWAILIIALIIGVVVIFFLLKGKKPKTEEPGEQQPKSRGFEGRSEEDL